MEPLIFSVPGEVRGKGRPRIVKIGGFSRMTADKATVSYESLVRLAAEQARGRRPPFECPLSVTLRARIVPATSASKKAQTAMLAGLQPPAKKPDLDNIIKVLDALNGIAFKDDAQIVEIVALKVYAETAGLDVSIRPYAAPASEERAA